MSRFTEAAYVVTDRLTAGGRPVVCLTSPMVYEVGFLGSGWRLEAANGFCTDLASVPVLVLRTGWGRRLADQIARSAIVHDLMRNDTRWPKLLGDYVFFEAMGVDRVPMGWRLICFAAVLINFRRD